MLYTEWVHTVCHFEISEEKFFMMKWQFSYPLSIQTKKLEKQEYLEMQKNSQSATLYKRRKSFKNCVSYSTFYQQYCLVRNILLNPGSTTLVMGQWAVQ